MFQVGLYRSVSQKTYNTHEGTSTTFYFGRTDLYEDDSLAIVEEITLVAHVLWAVHLAIIVL